MHGPPPKRPAEKVRKHYLNEQYPEVLLRFEDGYLHDMSLALGRARNPHGFK